MSCRTRRSRRTIHGRNTGLRSLASTSGKDDRKAAPSSPMDSLAAWGVLLPALATVVHSSARSGVSYIVEQVYRRRVPWMPLGRVAGLDRRQRRRSGSRRRIGPRAGHCRGPRSRPVGKPRGASPRLAPGFEREGWSDRYTPVSAISSGSRDGTLRSVVEVCLLSPRPNSPHRPSPSSIAWRDHV